MSSRIYPLILPLISVVFFLRIHTIFFQERLKKVLKISPKIVIKDCLRFRPGFNWEMHGRTLNRFSGENVDESCWRVWGYPAKHVVRILPKFVVNITNRIVWETCPRFYEDFPYAGLIWTYRKSFWLCLIEIQYCSLNS